MHQVFRAAAACALILLAWPAASQTPAPLRAWNPHPDGAPATEALRSFAAAVQAGTQGRYRIQFLPNAAIGEQALAVQMLKAGEIDVAGIDADPLSDTIPTLEAFHLPFLFSGAAHMFRHLDGPMGQRFTEKLKASGYVVLGWYNGGGSYFYCAEKPITRQSDMAGLRVRVRNVEAHAEMVRLLGAVPVPMPDKEVLEAFRSGKIDCAEGTMVDYEAGALYKAARYMLLDQHMISPEALVVSTRLWDRMAPEDQRAFLDAGKTSALLMRRLWEQRMSAARTALTKEGVQFSPVADFSPYVRRMAPLYKKYTAHPDVRGDLLTIISEQ